MQRYFLLSVFVLLTASAFGINRRMMEDKTLVGFQAGYMLPMGAYGKDVNGAVGGGIRGKYFGTNTFAIGFDFGFFAPTIQPNRITVITDSLNLTLEKEQYFHRISDTVKISGVTGKSQYIPFSLSFECYLPKSALNNFRPYAGMGLGLTMVNKHYNVTYNAPKTEESGILRLEREVQPTSTKGYLSIQPALGFLYTIDEVWNINVDIRYNQLLGEQKGGTLSVHFSVLWDLSFKYVR